MAKVHNGPEAGECKSPDGKLRDLEDQCGNARRKSSASFIETQGLYTKSSSVYEAAVQSPGTICLVTCVACVVLTLAVLAFRGFGPAGLTIPAGIAITLPHIGMFAAVWNAEEYSEWLKPGTTGFYLAFISVGALYTAACA